MISLLAALIVTVSWSFEFCVTDTLEHTIDCKNWTPLPGPYELSIDGSEYLVPVEVELGLTSDFFRVRRDWGEPNTILLAPLPEHNTFNSRNCPP